MKNFWLTLRLLCLTLLLASGAAPAFAAGALLAPPTATESETTQTDPFGRETPRSTVTGLLRALGSNDPAIAQPYLAIPDGARKRAKSLAPRLQAALDSGGTLATFQELSNAPEGQLDDGLAPGLERVGTLPGGNEPILLERKKNASGTFIWKIASQTLQALPDDLPASEATTSDDLVIAGAPLWDWATIFGLLVLAVIVARLASALVLLALRQVMSPDNAPYRLIHAALPPVALLVAIATFRLWSDGAAISIVARQLVLRYLGIAGLIAGVWLSLRLVDAFARWLSGRMERRQRHQSASVIVFARRVVKSALLIIVTLGILDTLGMDVTTGGRGIGHRRAGACSGRAEDGRKPGRHRFRSG